MIKDTLKVTGDVAIIVTDKDGNVKDSREIKNLVVTTGKSYIADRMANNTTAMSHMAVGAGTTAAANGDTVLGGELGRIALASTNVADNVISYVATFPAGTGTGAVSEAGIFNAATNGTLLCRTVFAVVNKGNDDTMSITWQITIS